MTPSGRFAACASSCRQAWIIVEPSTPFVPGFHIDAIIEHLEAVTRGQIRNLLINVPPRHMKSLLVSVFWPAWEWIAHPERRWLYSSYAASLSIRDSVKFRRLDRVTLVSIAAGAIASRSPATKTQKSGSIIADRAIALRRQWAARLPAKEATASFATIRITCRKSSRIRFARQRSIGGMW